MEIIKIIFILLILSIVVVSAIKHFIYTLSPKGIPLKNLTMDFRAKIWMTLCLGLTFFGLYLLIINVLSHAISTEKWLNLLYIIQHDPLTFVYAGLFIFVLLSLTIYLIRMIIKFFYTQYSSK